MKKHLPIFLITLVSFFLFLPLLLNISKASSLGETYLFFEKIKTNEASEMILLLTPSSNFHSTEEDRTIRITFSGGSGDWCQTGDPLSVSGVLTSAVDIGDWSIDEELPADVTFTASCNQSSSGDYIEITDIDTLDSGVGYGLKIDKDGTIFKTSSTVGGHLIIVQLVEGMNTESTAFSIDLLTDDQVVVTAEVSSADTITCSLSTNAVNIGTLYRGGAYTTADMYIQADSTSGFYWALYGQGDGNEAGLYDSESEDLLSSLGVEGRVDLHQGSGFGLVGTTNQGYIPVRYQINSDNYGEFGGIGMGLSNAKVLLYADEPSGTVSTSLYYGARAGLTDAVGTYTETILTFVEVI